MTEMTPAYYDEAAGRYDATRGGEQRADAAAAAIAELVPVDGTCLDLAGGTGIVSIRLAALGWSVLVLDGSTGMLTQARARLPGRVGCADARRLPVADGSLDLVTIIWMLNLVGVRTADAVLAEAARTLRPGGTLVLTVDKELAHDAGSTVVSDAYDRVTGVLAPLGLDPSGRTTFTARTRWGSATDEDEVFALAGFRSAQPGG